MKNDELKEVVKQIYISKAIEPMKAVIAINVLDGLEESNLPDLITLNDKQNIEFEYHLIGDAFETIVIAKRTIEHFYGLDKKFYWDI